MEDSNRSRILQAADELFNTRGYKSVTISDLAETLGMSKKTIYQYFPNKEEIASAVIEAVMGRVSEKFDRLIEPSEDPLAEIRSTFNQVKDEVARVSPLFQEDIRKFLPNLHQRIKEIRAKKIQNIERCIQAAQRMGKARDTVNARLATIVFLEAAQSLSKSDLSRHGFSKFEAIDTLIDIFVSGIECHSS